MIRNRLLAICTGVVMAATAAFLAPQAAAQSETCAPWVNETSAKYNDALFWRPRFCEGHDKNNGVFVGCTKAYLAPWVCNPK